MKVSAAGRTAITAREGRRLVAYRDSQGVLTIGVGHTGRMAPPPVTAGMTITEAQCDAFLEADLGPVETALNAILKRPVTQNQFDALASFLFNVGTGWAIKASIFTKINAGDIAGAAAAFDLFHVPPEIIGRRNGEKAQFLKPDAAAPPVPTLPPIKPSPAPAGSSPASDSGSKPATTESKPMSAATAGLDLGGVNIIAGLTNTVQNIISSITSSVKVVKAPNNSITVAPTTSSSGIVGSVFSSIGDAETAVAELQEIVSDAQGGRWSEEPSDVVHFLKTVFAILAKFGINIPVVSMLVSALPDLDPVAKAA